MLHNNSLNIKISVTVPAFKEKYLSRCIDSVLQQTYSNFELIIVDDNSPQGLKKIVDSFSDSRISYYKNEIGFGAEHVVGNWNMCIEKASGDYIICMGDDDMLLPNCLEEYVRIIKQFPGLAVYHGWSEEIDENDDVNRIFEPLPNWESVYSLIYYRLSGRPQFIGDFLYDLKWLKSIGGYYDLPFAWGSDNMTAYFAAANKGIAHTQIPVFQYRSNHSSISSSSHNKEKFDCTVQQYNWLKSFLAEKEQLFGIDALYRKQILKQLPFFFQNEFKYYMQQDFKSDFSFSSVKYWYLMVKKFALPTSIVLKSLIKSFC